MLGRIQARAFTSVIPKRQTDTSANKETIGHIEDFPGPYTLGKEQSYKYIGP